jgi:hypothetical protein
MGGMFTEVTQKRLEWWRVCGSQESKRTVREHEMHEVRSLVMARFGSEPRFEPEPMRTEPKFSSRFGLQPEPNLRSSSRFRQIAICLNLVQTGSN